MAPQRNVFALLGLVLYSLQTLGQTIVLDQSLMAAATVVSYFWDFLGHQLATEQT